MVLEWFGGGLVCFGVVWGVPTVPIWWQRWDDDKCQNGVALHMKSPGQDSGRVFSEGE